MHRITAEWISSKLQTLHLTPKVSSFFTQKTESLFAPPTQKNETMYLVDLTLESPRSLGAEAVILTSRFDRVLPGTAKPSDSASYSWAFLASFVHMVQHQRWRSKDLVIVLTPAPAGPRAAESWIERLSNVDGTSSTLQFRHSFIIASLSIELPPVPRFQTLAIKPESVLGTLPNLDLPNTIFRIAYRSDIHFLSWTPSNLITWSSLPTWLSNLAKTAPYSSFITNTRITEMNVLFSFMRNMAFGEPTGDHSAISKYKIEALTLSAQDSGSGKGTVQRFGEVLEGTLRSLNNLIEPLHQSFYYYFPLSPFTFVPIGHYMISFGLMFAPIAFFVLLTIIPAPGEHISTAVSTLAMVAPAGAVAFLLPTFLPDLLPFLAPLVEGISLTQEGHIATEVYISFVSTVSVCLVGLAATRYRKAKEILRSNPPKELRVDRADTVGAIALAPYLVFLAASVLLNASFGMIAIVATLPIVSIVLFKRRIPRVARFALTLLINPVIIVLAYPNFYPSVNLLRTFISNWENYSGLTFPFACLLLPISLTATVLALAEAD